MRQTTREPGLSSVSSKQSCVNAQELRRIESKQSKTETDYANIGCHVNLVDENYGDRDVKRIGAESVNGVVFSVPVKGTSSEVVVKVSNRPAEIKKEYDVGSLVNFLATKCPHFIWTYSLFSCGSPVKIEGDPDRKKYKMCPSESSDDDRRDHMVIESVRNPKDVSKLIAESWGRKEFLHCLFQVCHAIYIAQSYFRFVHNDLHGENVLVVDQPCEIKLENMGLSIRSPFTCRIIDYGMATYDLIDPKQKGVVLMKSNFTDVFRFIWSCEYYADRAKKPEIIDEVVSLVSRLVGVDIGTYKRSLDGFDRSDKVTVPTSMKTVRDGLAKYIVYNKLNG